MSRKLYLCTDQNLSISRIISEEIDWWPNNVFCPFQNSHFHYEFDQSPKEIKNTYSKTQNTWNLLLVKISCSNVVNYKQEDYQHWDTLFTLFEHNSPLSISSKKITNIISNVYQVMNLFLITTPATVDNKVFFQHKSQLKIPVRLFFFPSKNKQLDIRT